MVDARLSSTEATSAALVATALVGSVLFVLVEQRAAEPVLPIRVVTERTTALAITRELEMAESVVRPVLAPRH